MTHAIKRVKWKNIGTLSLIIVIVVVAIVVAGIITQAIEGECMQSGDLKVCFKLSSDAINTYQEDKIAVALTNEGTVTRPVKITMIVSPNLKAESETEYSIEGVGSKETVDKEFAIASQGEEGKFSIGFDVNGDGMADKELFITVK